MINLYVQLSKYILLILIACYTFECFHVFRYHDSEQKEGIYIRQMIEMVLLYFLSLTALCLQTGNLLIMVFYVFSQLIVILVMQLYKFVYPCCNRLLVNNMCMLLTIGFILLTRLSVQKAIRQFLIAVISLLVTMCIPFIIKKMNGLRKFTYVYAAIGIFALTSVMIFARVVNGSKLNLKIAGFHLQPSEFVKIVFVFAIAGILYKSASLKGVILATTVAAIHVLILVGSKDLGSAVIFFFVYLCMLYVATKKVRYLICGLCSGAMGAVIGYKMFAHVRVRVLAFKDPFSTIDDAGYQIAQSLFAIGTGGFFGMGINQGAPKKIPVVAEDFIFSAMSEELGVLFSLCVLLICVSCFVMFMNIAMLLEDDYYKYVALGLAVMYAFQVFLTVGGVTKFIPLTGVTLPLVSYGGNSVLVTLMMFAVIQGLYVRQKENQNGKNERKRYKK